MSSKKSTTKLFCWNVNGIRAVQKGGFMDWMKTQNMDILCVQEIKARPEQLEKGLVHPHGYHSIWNPAQKPGYSGTATFSKTPPLDFTLGLGIPEFDIEGRVITTEFEGFYVVNAYFPNSQREHTRLAYKLSFCVEMQKHLKKLAKKKEVILCGDYNIAHEEIDLKNPQSNKDNAGFLPEERAWMTHHLQDGFHDVFRQRNPGAGGNYTWWSYRPGVREKNVGWRIDYHTMTEGLVERTKKIGHQPEVLGSDHCPIYIEIVN